MKFSGAKAADATSLQIPGVLDDLFYFDGQLGALMADDGVTFRLWAPTAQNVCLYVYDAPDGTVPTIYSMTQKDEGVWETKVGHSDWIWAREYHVDGFRFDLMSFSFKRISSRSKRRCTKSIRRSTSTVKVGTSAK